MTHTVIYVPPERCRDAWPDAKRHLQPAIEASNGRWTPEYVLAALVLNEQALWLVTGGDSIVVGAVTTQVAVYPERKLLAIHFLGGDGFDEWYQALLKTMTDHARETGCDAIECNARFGFWKWFKQDGFKKASVFYEKKV